MTQKQQPVANDPKAWARAIIRRKANGQKVSSGVYRMACDALGLVG
jgi:hypothetical protein